MSRPGPPNPANPGPTRLRQIALVARDLPKARQLLTHVLGTEVVYVDPGVGKWGLENFLICVGGEIIEVVSPTREGTAAGRFLDKKGVDAAGYMIIMQNADANKRREYIEKNNLAQVIFRHDEQSEAHGAVCVQYNPKGIRGGVIPELDSQGASKEFPDPMKERFSPWHPCGPNHKTYISTMKKYAHLSLVGAVCRLAPGDWGSELASTQWEKLFGVSRSRDLLAFTNARVGFLHGEEGKQEGITTINIGVLGQRRKNEILKRAEDAGVLVKDPQGRQFAEMVGVRFGFTLVGEDELSSKL